MIERKLTIAEIILLAGTRVALGAGIGLLLSSRLNNDQRKAAGWALALVGALHLGKGRIKHRTGDET